VVVASIISETSVNFSNFVTALMEKAVNTSETSAKFYMTTWRNIPKDRHFHIRRLENPKLRNSPEVKIIKK
jgi:hypothetical protein